MSPVIGSTVQTGVGSTHFLLQLPQDSGSRRETHVPLHLMRLGGRPAPEHWHWPPLQIPPLHELPQAPQLDGLVWVLVHSGAPPSSPAHFSCPDGQSCVHVPETHDLPPPHTTPQPPQFNGSLVIETHWPLQNDVPAVHRQVPPLQIRPPVQMVPHAPQLLGSD